MNSNDLTRFQELALQYATDLGVKVIAAIMFWVIGRWLIGLVGRAIQSSLERQKVDATDPALIHTVRGVGYVLRETPP